MSTIGILEHLINPPKKRRSKFGNVRTEVITQGERILYDSKREAEIGNDLRIRELGHEISELKHQVPFSFELNGILICRYFADFTYIENGKLVVCDIKSKITAKIPMYVLKKKMMRAFHNIEILEII